MGNIKCTPHKFTIETMKQICDEMYDWYIANPNELSFYNFLLTKKFPAKNGKDEYCKITTFNDNWKQAHKFVQDLIDELKKIQELRLLDGLAKSPAYSGKYPNGCRFVLQTKYGYIPKEEVKQTFTGIDLTFNELKDSDI